MHIRTWAIGLFILIGIGALTAILFMIGNRLDIFGTHMEFYSDFANISGLQDGAQVRVGGLQAGEVKGIEVPADPNSKFRLKLQVETKVHGIIRKDSVVSIASEGIVGDKYVSIQAGKSSSPVAKDGDTLPSKPPFDITVVEEKGIETLGELQQSVKDIHGRVDVALDSLTHTVNHVDGLVTAVKPNITQMASNGRQITGTLNDLVSDLNAGKGPAGMFLKDEAVRQRLEATVSNAQHATSSLSDASARVDGVIADLQSRNLPAKAQETLDNVDSISQQLNGAIKGALGPDNMGKDGAGNIRETLSNLNRGTANLAEDTEALKHEFFFRGFFKKRGFYNLQDLAPAVYLKACEHDKRCQSRAWLDATNLFTSGGDGQQQLMPAGLYKIDAAVAPYLVSDSLLNHIVIVEGYSTAGTPDQQFATSWKRADLVREYLETRFHLLHSDVGIVPLRDKPPQGAEREIWNGVAIVVFDDRKQ